VIRMYVREFCHPVVPEIHRYGPAASKYERTANNPIQILLFHFLFIVVPPSGVSFGETVTLAVTGRKPCRVHHTPPCWRTLLFRH
jgi:hypothetical protein